MRAVADGVAHDDVQQKDAERTGMHWHDQREQWQEEAAQPCHPVHCR